MRATDILGSVRPAGFRWRGLLLAALLALIGVRCGTRCAAGDAGTTSTNEAAAALSPRERVQTRLRDARASYLAATNDPVRGWQLGRACFEWNELMKDPKQEERVAKEGIAASRQAVALDPQSAQAHYYLGLTLGQFADTKRNMAALKIVKEMEREFNRTLELDEHLDYGGADRNLGLLYLQAPTLISIGSRSKARSHLRRAVELAPGFPENRLNLIETLLAWGDANEARLEWVALEKSWHDAQTKLTGPDWAAAWPEWQNRLDAAKKKIAAGAK